MSVTAATQLGAGPLGLEAEAGQRGSHRAEPPPLSTSVLQPGSPLDPPRCIHVPPDTPSSDSPTLRVSRPMHAGWLCASLFPSPGVQAPGREEAASKTHPLLSCPIAPTLIQAPTPACRNHLASLCFLLGPHVHFPLQAGWETLKHQPEQASLLLKPSMARQYPQDKVPSFP